MTFVPCYTARMEDTARYGAPQLDLVGRRHTLSISRVAIELQAAGVPRSHRHIVRMCKSGSFDAGKYPGPSGDEWLVAPDSIAKVTGDLRALEEARARRTATQRAASDPVVVETRIQNGGDMARHGAPQPDVANSETSQKGSETEPAKARYVAQLEKRIEEKDEVIGMLRGELANRNEEIVRRNERERETNILIRGLQNLVLRLQPGRNPQDDVLHNDPMMREQEGESTMS
jgi:hypothetical protein